MNRDEMQPQHRRFFDELDWDGGRGLSDKPRHVDAEDGLDGALDQLRRQTKGILSEYEDRQSFTPPSRERRDAHQKAIYEQQKRTQDRPEGRGSS